MDTTTSTAADGREPSAPYERPRIEDYGSLAELTAGSKEAWSADQYIGVIPIGPKYS
jgi:hypothetical protein